MTTIEPTLTFDFRKAIDKNHLKGIWKMMVDYRLPYFAATASLLDTLTGVGSIPVVFSSSCAVYGKPECLPIAEDHPQRQINPYGRSKLFVEHMLGDLSVACGLG